MNPEETKNSSETPQATSAEETPSGDAAQARIAQLEADVKERDQKYVYLYAEFENYKKRAVRERMEASKFGWENVARDLLQVIDNLERGLAHMPATTDPSLAEGLKMVTQQFRSTLEKQGVQAIVAVNQPFDPNLHEAVGQMPSQEHAAGINLQEHQTGYTLHGRLLRPSRVVISTGVSTGSGQEKA